MICLLSKDSCCSSVSVLFDRHVRRYFGEHGVDLIARFQGSAARDLAPRGRRRKLELQRLRVEQTHVGDGVARIRDVVPRQADNGELVTMRSEWNLLTKRQASGAIKHHFVVAAHDPVTGDKLARPAGTAQFVTD
jgi:hypothetical protein